MKKRAKAEAAGRQTAEEPQAARAAPADAAGDASPREVKPGASNSFVLQDQKNADWRHDPEPGTPRENLTLPAYLAVFCGSGRAQPGDVVRVHGQDAVGSYFAEILLYQAGRGMEPAAKVLRIVDLPQIAHKDALKWPVGYEPKFDGRWNAWFVIRQSDGARMTQEPGARSLLDLFHQFCNSAIFRR